MSDLPVDTEEISRLPSQPTTSHTISPTVRNKSQNSRHWMQITHPAYHCKHNIKRVSKSNSANWAYHLPGETKGTPPQPIRPTIENKSQKVHTGLPMESYLIPSLLVGTYSHSTHAEYWTRTHHPRRLPLLPRTLVFRGRTFLLRRRALVFRRRSLVFRKRALIFLRRALIFRRRTPIFRRRTLLLSLRTLIIPPTPPLPHILPIPRRQPLIPRLLVCPQPIRLIIDIIPRLPPEPCLTLPILDSRFIDQWVAESGVVVDLKGGLVFCRTGQGGDSGVQTAGFNQASGTTWPLFVVVRSVSGSSQAERSVGRVEALKMLVLENGNGRGAGGG